MNSVIYSKFIGEDTTLFVTKEVNFYAIFLETTHGLDEPLRIFMKFLKNSERTSAIEAGVMLAAHEEKLLDPLCRKHLRSIQ